MIETWIFYCQSCGAQHTMPSVTSANITICTHCGGQSFATWKPPHMQPIENRRAAVPGADRNAIIEKCASHLDTPIWAINSVAMNHAAKLIRALKSQPPEGSGE